MGMGREMAEDAYFDHLIEEDARYDEQYGNEALRKEINDLKERVKKLESWVNLLYKEARQP